MKTRSLVLCIALCIIVPGIAVAKEGCIIAGGNQLCCNCSGSGSCGAAGCKWTGGLDGSCGPKTGTEFLANVKTEVELSNQLVTKSQAKVLAAEAALAKARATAAAAKRASDIAKRNLGKASAAIPAAQH